MYDIIMITPNVSTHKHFFQRTLASEPFASNMIAGKDKKKSAAATP